MTKTAKRALWIGGLAGGAAAVIAVLAITSKSTSSTIMYRGVTITTEQDASGCHAIWGTTGTVPAGTVGAPTCQQAIALAQVTIDAALGPAQR